MIWKIDKSTRYSDKECTAAVFRLDTRSCHNGNGHIPCWWNKKRILLCLARFDWLFHARKEKTLLAKKKQCVYTGTKWKSDPAVKKYDFINATCYSYKWFPRRSQLRIGKENQMIFVGEWFPFEMMEMFPRDGNEFIGVVELWAAEW